MSLFPSTIAKRQVINEAVKGDIPADVETCRKRLKVIEEEEDLKLFHQLLIYKEKLENVINNDEMDKREEERRERRVKKFDKWLKKHDIKYYLHFDKFEREDNNEDYFDPEITWDMQFRLECITVMYMVTKDRYSRKVCLSVQDFMSQRDEEKLKEVLEIIDDNLDELYDILS